MFTAIAEPTRRNILEMLGVHGHLAASDIYKQFSATPPAISQHLKVLREAKLVRVEKKAQQRIYYVNHEPMKQLANWVKQFTKTKETEYRRLDSLLEKMRSEAIDEPRLPFE